MKNALLTFLILLALLGVGTLLIVEEYSHEQILPRSIKGVSLVELTLRYERGKRDFTRWWNRAADKIPESLSTPKSQARVQENNIIEWQDEQGLWHYENAVPREYESPAPQP